MGEKSDGFVRPNLNSISSNRFDYGNVNELLVVNCKFGVFVSVVVLGI